jgi:peptidoglycan/xylan/chitin deacetylase (PgdA/CDA1 family)
VDPLKALKIAACWVMKLVGLNMVFRFLNRNRVLILWYHGISRDGFDLLQGYDERHLPRSLFRQHLKYLIRHGYRFIAMDDYVQACRSRTVLTKAVVLTFDDGFRNVIENAVPEMTENHAQGIMYVVVGSARLNQLLWTDQVESWVREQNGPSATVTISGQCIDYLLRCKAERETCMRDIKTRLRALDDQARREQLHQFNGVQNASSEFQIASLAQLKAVQPKVLQIASHTMNHPNCTRLKSAGEFAEELGNAKNVLETELSTPVLHFAYPAGNYNDSVIAQVKKFSYQTAVTTTPGFNDLSSDLFQLKRIGTNQSLIMFEAMTSGAYFAFSRLFKT